MGFRAEALKARADECSALAKKLHDLSLKTYPSEGLKTFVSCELIAVNEQLRRIFTEEMAALKRHDGSEKPQLVIRAVAVFGELSKLVEAVSVADLKAHPLEIMLYLKDVVRVTDNAPVEFITSPMGEMNFSFREVWQSLRSSLRTDLGLDFGNDTRFVHFTFPTLHKDNPLLGTIYAHELGHYLDRSNQIWEKVFARASRHRNIRRMLKVIKTIHPTATQPALLLLLRRHVLAPWIKEIVADTIGVYLLGPAFQLAAQAIDMFQVSETYPQMLDYVGTSHPSSRLRTEHRMDLLRRIGYFDACPTKIQASFVQASQWWAQAPKVYAKDLPQEFLDLAEEILRDMIPHIERHVEQTIPKQVRLTVDDLSSVVPGLIKRIGLLTPPNELNGVPASSGAILNAGWFASLTILDDLRFRIKGYDAEDKHYELQDELFGLIRYALYASRVHRRWADIGGAD